MRELKYPVGMATFSELIRKGNVYVDKTTYLSGTPAIAEWHSYKGRSDLEVFAGGNVYIFEFKYNKSVEEAMDQIHSRDYAGKYALDSRKVYLIAANYISKKENRGLQYEVLRVKS